ncbi:putative exported protein [Burkholderia pseudomallei 1710b]|uniref:Putative exported protein n=1 Tax=Burkholderia pseudomallei (strain 1710b) TaxID=320372 RepID=Q3JRA5_BURP1|nr:putative exported protein [Burkholderia pseudomallei 1710b]EDK56751.1 hypothetical protein BMAFMH_C1032 [Burkholderia mallei FMH]
MMRPTKMAFVLALACAGFLASDFACAQRPERGAPPSHKVPRGNGAARRPAPPGEPPARAAAVPPDLEQRRRDGHMTPEERHLLRQHIEDAVRELYKR